MAPAGWSKSSSERLTSRERPGCAQPIGRICSGHEQPPGNSARMGQALAVGARSELTGCHIDRDARGSRLRRRRGSLTFKGREHPTRKVVRPAADHFNNLLKLFWPERS